jgi:hypothetical protein
MKGRRRTPDNIVLSRRETSRLQFDTATAQENYSAFESSAFRSPSPMAAPHASAPATVGVPSLPLQVAWSVRRILLARRAATCTCAHAVSLCLWISLSLSLSLSLARALALSLARICTREHTHTHTHTHRYDRLQIISKLEHAFQHVDFDGSETLVLPPRRRPHNPHLMHTHFDP